MPMILAVARAGFSKPAISRHHNARLPTALFYQRPSFFKKPQSPTKAPAENPHEPRPTKSDAILRQLRHRDGLRGCQRQPNPPRRQPHSIDGKSTFSGALPVQRATQTISTFSLQEPAAHPSGSGIDASSNGVTKRKTAFGKTTTKSSNRC